MFINLSGQGPLYRQVYEGLRQAVLSGRLRPGDQLPSTRRLAEELGVSRNVVLIAFEQLMAEGYTESVVGSGTFVCSSLPDELLSTSVGNASSALENQTLAPPSRLSRYGQRVKDLDISEAQPRMSRPLPFDFRYGFPNIADFPHEIWRRLVSRRLRKASIRFFFYGDPAGSSRLREVLANYLRTARGLQCDTDQVIVVNGSQQALSLVSRVLIEPGDHLAIEEPTYQGARQIFEAVGAQLQFISLDHEGMDVERLRTGSATPKLVYVTPSHQFPSGVVMSVSRRLALLRWAERTNAYLFEDDYDSEYRYKGRPLQAVQGLDTSGRVIYAGTLSKVLFPAARLGYLVVPPVLAKLFTRAKYLADHHTPILQQEVLADFILEGHFGRHLRRSRKSHGERREALLEALHRYLGEQVRISGENAGIHVLAWLPDFPQENLDLLIRRCASQGVGIYSVAPHYSNSPPMTGLLLGYASLEKAQIEEGINRLSNAIKVLIGRES